MYRLGKGGARLRQFLSRSGNFLLPSPDSDCALCPSPWITLTGGLPLGREQKNSNHRGAPHGELEPSDATAASALRGAFLCNALRNFTPYHRAFQEFLGLRSSERFRSSWALGSELRSWAHVIRSSSLRLHAAVSLSRFQLSADAREWNGCRRGCRPSAFALPPYRPKKSLLADVAKPFYTCRVQHSCSAGAPF